MREPPLLTSWLLLKAGGGAHSALQNWVTPQAWAFFMAEISGFQFPSGGIRVRRIERPIPSLGSKNNWARSSVILSPTQALEAPNPRITWAGRLASTRISSAQSNGARPTHINKEIRKDLFT